VESHGEKSRHHHLQRKCGTRHPIRWCELLRLFLFLRLLNSYRATSRNFLFFPFSDSFEASTRKKNIPKHNRPPFIPLILDVVAFRESQDARPWSSQDGSNCWTWKFRGGLLLSRIKCLTLMEGSFYGFHERPSRMGSIASRIGGWSVSADCSRHGQPGRGRSVKIKFGSLKIDRPLKSRSALYRRRFSQPKKSFESAWRDLSDLHYFAPLQSQNRRVLSSNVLTSFKMERAYSIIFSRIIRE